MSEYKSAFQLTLFIILNFSNLARSDLVIFFCFPAFFCLSLCLVVKTLVLNKISALEVSEFANVGDSYSTHTKGGTRSSRKGEA